MTELADDSKKDVTAVCAAKLRSNPEEQGRSRLPESTKGNMRTFMARSGRLLAVIALFLGIPACLMAEGEVVDAGASAGVDPGLGVFSRFPLNFSLSVRGGYDDNVTTGPSGFDRGAAFASASLNLSLSLQTPRTTVSTATALGFTYYSGGFNTTEPNLNLPITITHKISPRLQIGATILMTYQQEPDFQHDAGSYQRIGNYFFTQDNLHADFIWAPRFSTVTTYSILAVQYDDMAAGLFQDRVENTIGNQFRFLLWPTTNLVGEYRFGVVSYSHISRDSTTQTLLAGVDHQFSPRLTAGFRAGAEFRDYEDTGEEDSPHFEANVGYRFGKDTSASWTISYGLEEGNVGSTGTRESFRTGLVANRNLTARLGANLSLFYNHDDYSEGVSLAPGAPPVPLPGFVEDSFDITLSLRYAMTRYLGVDLGYTHTEVSSDVMFRDYSRNSVYGGFTVSF